MNFIAAEILEKILDVAHLKIIRLSIYQPTPFRANINAYRLPIDLYRAMHRLPIHLYRPMHRFTNEKSKMAPNKNCVSPP